MSVIVSKTSYLKISDGDSSVTLEQKTETITPTGTKKISNSQSIGLTWEAIDFGDLGTLGEVGLENTDATNYVELALDNAGAQKFAKLRAGMRAIIPFSTKTVYSQANIGACVVNIIAAEE
jgi:hypothetical protein